MERKMVFGSNLKYYREKQGLTQKQLADTIGYTEKSISKWENENGLPTLEVLARLSDQFGISLDELVYENNDLHYFLGIDGGGTKTMFRLVAENGTVINTVQKGSSNPNDIGMENAFVVLKEGISQVCRGIPYGKVTMFAGLSGGGLTGDNAQVLHKFFGEFGFAAYENGSDVENLIALADREKCTLVIMGTGFIVYALNGSRRKRIAGWGQFFDEGGCGYTLGRDAITAVLRQEDDSGERTVLAKLLTERIGETAEAHLAKFYQGGKRYIAEFSDLVLEGVRLDDKVARDILEKNMAFAAAMIDTAVRELRGVAGSVPGHAGTNSVTLADEQIPVFISGGISAGQEMIFPLIDKYAAEKNRQLIRLKQEPVEGALRRARRIYESSRKGETDL